MNVADMAPDQRLDFYAEMFFDGLHDFGEFGALPLEQRSCILRDVLDDMAATGADDTGMFTRETIVECLRQDDARVTEQGS
jgi:hypothetical protein